jgi:hypothetical protein
MPGTAAWLTYVRVANADRAAETVARLGGKVLNGPMEVPGGGRIATCVDPQGAAFALHSVQAAAAPAKRAVKKKAAKKKVAKKKVAKKKAVKKKAATKKRSTPKKKRKR